ncbi:hypothetical protein [Vibrio barjaei]|uniref:hypothetical protein n=1 Tax=Vibrio barjaei TaxID=1676683 RepID=UPI0007BB3DDD|nr:hypothetical protein [Vibrio barjaei]OIN27369.1 hypothetical protein AWH66_2011750 [Vibrio barjaei]
MRKFDSFSLLVAIVSSLFFFILGVGLTAFTAVESVIGDVATWVAAVGTVGSLIYLARDNVARKSEYKSEVALNSYRSAIDALNVKLQDSSVQTDAKWLFISSAYYELASYLQDITVDSHIEIAKISYSSLIPNLVLYYHHLEVHDFIDMPKDTVQRYPLPLNNRSISVSAEILITSWLRYVAGNNRFFKDVGFQSYEHSAVLEKKYALLLLAMLDVKDGFPRRVEQLSEFFNQLNRELIVTQFTFSRMALDEYSALVSHVLLCDTLNAKAYYYSATKSAPRPYLRVYGPENAWVIIGNTVIRYPTPCLEPKAYKSVLHSGSKIPANLGGFKIFY